jgi:hypothetical protein
MLREAGISETDSSAETKIMSLCTNLMTSISAAVSLGLCRWGKFYWSSNLSSRFLMFSFVTTISYACEMLVLELRPNFVGL